MPLVDIVVNTTEPLEWQQDQHEALIDSFKYKVEDFLLGSVNGFGKVTATFSYDPRTTKFKLLENSRPHGYHFEMLVDFHLKEYFN